MIASRTARGAASLACAIAFAAAIPAHAAPVSGTLSLAGAIGLNATTIDFLPTATGTGAAVLTSASQSGDFVALEGTAAAVGDIVLAAPLPLPAFVTLAANPDIALSLTSLEPGVFPSAFCGVAPAVGQTCSPPGSPLNFVNTGASSSTVSFTGRGIATRISTAEMSSFVATFTAQFATANYQSVQAAISAAGTVSSTFSAVVQVTPGGAPVTADFSIAKTDGSTVAQAGGATTYSIVVTNLGPGAASATVADAFPAAVTGVAWTCAASPGSSCPSAGVGNLAANVVLLPGGTATFTATAAISPTATGTLANTATVAASGGATDPTPGNDQSTDVDTLLPAPVTAIPTLSALGFGALALLLGLGGLAALRRSRRTSEVR